MDGPSDGVVTVAKSKCLSGTFASVDLHRKAGDCRRYKVKGQENDEATGSLNVLLHVDASACKNVRDIDIESNQFFSPLGR